VTDPRGIRNNNPGNIVKSGIAWQGKVAGDDPRFETFDSPQNGLRALCSLLLTYYRKYDLRTPRAIINRWAPPPENDTGAYAATVANALGVGADVEIDVEDCDTLCLLCAAIVSVENGVQPYARQLIVEAALSALGRPATEPSTPSVEEGRALNREQDGLPAGSTTLDAASEAVASNPVAPASLTPPETAMPVFTALLPTILQLIPGLIGIFGKGGCAHH